MEIPRFPWIQRLRIVWAIAAKDIVDGFKNRTTLSLMLATAITMLSAQALPLLLNLSGIRTVIVYDAGDSRVPSALRESSGVRLMEARSNQEMLDLLVDVSGKVLAVVVPADFEQVLGSGEEPELEGYVAWADRGSAAQLASDLEDQLQDTLGAKVRVRVEGNVVHAPREGTAQLGMVATGMVLVLAVIGSLLVPHLLLEERQTHTLEVLLISPASTSEVIAGKAWAGLVYSLAGMGVVLAFNRLLVAHWGIAVLATVCGSVLFIAIGLGLGSLFETPQQMGLWVAVPFFVLVLPAMALVVPWDLPEPVATLLPWIPSVALGRAYLLSFSGLGTLTQSLSELAIVLVWAVPFYALVVWLVRRSDR
jgi:ABC-2 type transport system permease protein